MTKIRLKSVIEFLFWIVLFVLALAFLNKSWSLSLYFIIGTLLFVLLIIEIILNFEHRHKTKSKEKIKKEIKTEHIKPNKKFFYKELTSLFSFVVALIIIFSIIIQKNKFIEFLSFKYHHSYLIPILVILALVILVVQLIEHRRIKKKEKEKSKVIIKMRYDFIFLFGLVIVILAYVFSNLITTLLGLILMVVSLIAYHLTHKKEKVKKEIHPKKIISKKISKEQKLKLLFQSSGGVLNRLKQEEKKAKEEEHTERLKLKELQRKIREEERSRKKAEKLRKKQEKLLKAREIAKQEKIKKEKERLGKIRKVKEEIIKKEEKLGKIKKSREEIDEIIKMHKSIKPKGKYETDFDRLLDLIKKYEKLNLSDVAKIFNIDSKKAEEWATILEEHNLLDIHYPAIGEPELRIKK